MTKTIIITDGTYQKQLYVNKDLNFNQMGHYLSNYIDDSGTLVLEFDTTGAADGSLGKEVYNFIKKGITSNRLIDTNKNTTNLIQLLKND